MRFPEPIPTNGDKGLPKVISDVHGALRAMQLIGTNARASSSWRQAWESLWKARDTGSAADVERAASAVQAMLRAQKCLAGVRR